MSPRETMRHAIADCLRRIRKADGYSTDAGRGVELEPMPKLESGDAAFITVVWSRQARPAPPAVQRTHRATTFDVIAKVPANIEETQDVLDQITGDIERAMACQSFRYPNGYSVPEYVQAEPLVVHFGAQWVGVAISYMSNIPIR